MAWSWLCASLSIALAMSLRGLRKGSLNATGATAALVVGTLHMYCGLQYGLTLIFFYLSSSKLTRLQSARKAQLEADFKAGGQRGVAQVLSNSLGACVSLAALLWHQQQQHGSHPRQGPSLGREQLVAAALTGAFLGHYCCCCSDTWASEVGILSRSRTRLVTTWAPVPPGTNGGVTWLGLASGAAGAAATGVVFWACEWLARRFGSSALSIPQAPLLPLLALCLLLGLSGCMLDSLLGATMQFSGLEAASGKVTQRPGKGVTHISGLALLSNDAVNLAAAAGTAVAGAWAMWQWYQRGGLGL